MAEKELLSKLLNLHKVEQRRIKRERVEGKCFNVFSALNLCSDEVRLHSRLLATLLNPNADHGLGNTFLKLFLNRIGLPEDYITSCKGQLVERYVGEVTRTDGGRIDIILEDGKHAIIIENKINANDQPNQLLRYYNYGEKQWGKNNFKLVYLTLYGCAPPENSLGDRKIESIKLSYAKDVLELLESSVHPESQIPIYRTIQDYITIVKQLTFQDINITHEENIIQEALNHIEATSTLMRLRDKIDKALRERYILFPLEQWAKDKNISYEVDHEDNGALLLTPKNWTDFSIRIKTDSNRWQYLWISIVKKSNTTNNTKERKLDCFSHPSESDNLLGWSWICDNNRNDWHNPEQYPQIRDGKVLGWIQNKIEEIIKQTEKETL